MKKLKEHWEILIALLTVTIALSGVIGSAVLYAESTYYKVEAAKEQFREVKEGLEDVRLDGLYRDKAECDAALKRGQPESALCQRVSRQIETIEGKRGNRTR